MTIPNIWKSKKCSKPPTSLNCMKAALRVCVALPSAWWWYLSGGQGKSSTVLGLKWHKQWHRSTQKMGSNPINDQNIDWSICSLQTMTIMILCWCYKPTYRIHDVEWHQISELSQKLNPQVQTAAKCENPRTETWSMSAFPRKVVSKRSPWTNCNWYLRIYLYN